MGLTAWQQEAGALYRTAYQHGAEMRPEMEQALRNGLDYSPPSYVVDPGGTLRRSLRRDLVLTLGWLHGMAGAPRDTTAAYDLARELER